MSDEVRFREIRRIVLLAADADGEERRRILDTECGADGDLRAEVLRFLDGPTVATKEIFDAGGAGPDLHAAPEAIGPFHIERELGRGGMGVVYQALDERSGRPVALKEVYPHLLASSRIVERFTREAEAGKRIDHANVVRTLGYERVADKGVTHDLLVMEFVEGRTLRDLSRSLGPLSEPMLRELARQVAAGLTAIHAAGVVHRDLKPENILVTDDQRVRIMDLGVARLREASVALTREGEFVGSLLYAAPEQCRGEEVGPAVDQYALGVLLYELATGKNPFSRTRAAAIYAAQIEVHPPHLDQVEEAFSPFFAEVVAELLAKKPAERFPSSEELLRVLTEGEAGEWWRERAAFREPRGRARLLLPVAREVAFRGREEALALLHRAWSDAKEGNGSTVLVEGEAGLGKTRLVDRFMEETGGAEACVLAGAFSASGGVCGVTEALLDRFGDRIEEELERRLETSPEVASKLARLTRGEHAEANRDVFVHSCGRILRSLSGEGPVLWVADDAHLASPAARAAIGSLARAASECRALLVLTARPLTGEEAGSLGAELSRAGPVRRISLSRLDREEVEDLLAAAFGSEVTAGELAAPVTERSEGVPFFVLEMIAALRDDGFLRQTPSGEWVVARPLAELGLPGATRELLAARVAGLDREEREILDIAAVAGSVFDAELVASILGRSLVSVLKTLAELQRRGGLVGAFGRRFRFDHSLLADYLYDSLPELLRDEYHGLLADAIRAQGGEVDGSRAALLAKHYLLSRRPREALPFLTDALEHLAGLHRYEDFLRSAERALGMEGLLDGEIRARVLLKTCVILRATGRSRECREAAEEARRIAIEAGDPGLRGSAHLYMGMCATNTGKLGEGVAHHRAAIALARAAGDEHLELGALANLGASLIRAGDREEALTRLRAAHEAAVRIGDGAAELQARVNIATIDHRAGQVEAARAGYLESIEIARRVGSRSTESYAESCLGLLEWNSGAFDDAVRRLKASLAIATEIGSRPAQLGALAHLAVVEHSRGHHVQALRTQERLLALRREFGDRGGESSSLAAIGESKLHLGDLEGARANMEASLDIAATVDNPLLRADVLLALSELEWNEGNPDAARAAAGRSREQLGDAGESGLLVGCGLAFARLAMEEERFEEARAELEAVRGLAEECGQAGLHLLLRAQLANLPGGDTAEIEARLPELESRAPSYYRIEARFLLWRATGNERHLAEARRLAREERERAGPGHRDAMAKNLRLHREIEAAWGATAGSS